LRAALIAVSTASALEFIGKPRSMPVISQARSMNGPSRSVK
jgi:hypothetical protein